MLRSLALPLIALIGVGCGVGDPSTLSGSAGSGASGRGGRGGRGGSGGRGGAAGNTGAAGFIDEGCGASDYAVELVRPEILIVLDASGSMNDDASGAVCDQGCGAMSKWAATVAAINATVARSEATVNWGLKLFPDGGGRCDVVANTVAVPPGAGNAAAIATALAGHTSANGGISNGGSTPTRAAEDAAITYLATRTTSGAKFILLATDGLPNCAPDKVDTAADDSAGTVQSVVNARTAGYPTFVVGVGIGDATAGATLDQMAAAGGYARAGSPAYYPVASTAELDAVMTTLVTVAASCTFAVPAPPTSYARREYIGVRVDGVEIPHDRTHENGWDYTDGAMMAIELHGAQCAAVMAGEVRKVSIYFVCPGP